jgi:hypothetical protein
VVLSDDRRCHRGRAAVAHVVLPGAADKIRLGRPAHSRPSSERRDLKLDPVAFVSEVFAQRAVREVRNVDGRAAVRFGTNQRRALGLVAIANLTCCSSAQLTPGDQPDMSQEGSMMKAACRRVREVRDAEGRTRVSGCTPMSNIEQVDFEYRAIFAGEGHRPMTPSASPMTHGPYDLHDWRCAGSLRADLRRRFAR